MMTKSSKLSWLSCVILHCLVHGREEPGPNIAVIGAGIGGAAFSHYIRELLPHTTIITVYEATTEMGGRIGSFPYVDVGSMDHHEPKTYEIEQGASIIYNGNMLAQEAVRKLHLDVINIPRNESVGFWDGQTLVARTGALGLLELTRINISQALREGRLMDEFVAAANGVNYNQGSHTTIYCTDSILLCYTLGELFKVVGGNKQLASGLLKASGAQLKQGVKVTSVVNMNGEKTSQMNAKNGENGAKLSRSGAAAAAAATSPQYALYSGDNRLDDQTFQTTHSTFVVGNIRPEAFGWGTDEPFPSVVLLTKDGREKEMWSSISVEKKLQDGRSLYKLFSRSELPSGVLDVIFGNNEYSVVNHKEWAAYPKLDPVATKCSLDDSTSPCYPILPFSGHHSILYLNAIEMAASAIEISMISAKNAALLLNKNWKNRETMQTIDDVRTRVVQGEKVDNAAEEFPKTMTSADVNRHHNEL